jgi:hypothetical protein
MQSKTFGEIHLINSINVESVIDILKNKPELWNLDKTRQTLYEEHKETESIILIFTNNTYPYERKINKELIGVFKPFLNELISILNEHFKYSQPVIVKLIFAKLKAGGKIKPHIDNGFILQVPNRIHIPIIPNDDVIFTINKKQKQFKKGNMYNFNNTMEHSVINNSSTDRVHCIIDYSCHSIFN